MEYLASSSVRRLVRVLFFLAVVAGLVFALRGVSLERTTEVLREARVGMLGAWTAVLIAVNVVLRSARFWVIIRGSPHERARLRFRDVVSAMLLNQAANNVLPLRAGEIVRTREIVEHGYSVTVVAFAQLTEKVVELMAIATFIAPVLLADRRIRPFAPLLAFLLPVALWGARRLHRFAVSAVEVGGAARTQRRAVWLALGWALLADASEVALIHFCLQSLGLPADFTTSITVYAGVNVAIAVPSTPGQFGAFEAGAVLSLVAIGVPRPGAVAFAALYRITQWVPVTFAAAALLLYRSGTSALERTRG